MTSVLVSRQERYLVAALIAFAAPCRTRPNPRGRYVWHRDSEWRAIGSPSRAAHSGSRTSPPSCAPPLRR